MKKSCYGKFHYSILVLVLSLTMSNAFGQGFYNTTNWRYSNPKRFGFTVFDLDFFDNNRGIAVGNNGGIAYTTDGGANWSYGAFTFISPAGLLTSSTLNDVHFITSTVAYAVGSNGCIAKTIDGGATWSFVNNPLYANAKNINAVWFLDANKGYMGGDVNNAADSLPRLYVTLNGGATWDSIAPPAVNGVSRVGYINNPLIPSVLYPVDAKLKSIQRIEFTDNNTAYICGNSSYGVTLFPAVSKRATSATVCTPLTTDLTSGSMGASLLWKFKDGVLTDYSLSKERLGYSGINTNTINCTSAYANITPNTQLYKAMSIINDSMIVLMSFNSNIVVRVHTGILDSTVNVATGLKERGRYVLTSFPSPPTQGPNAGPAIPNPNNLLASNPYFIKKAPNGKLFAPVGSSLFAPENKMYTSIDTGRTWQLERNLPSGRLYSNVTNIALDILPSGKFVAAGVNGVVSDSLPGGAWNSNYVSHSLAVTGLDMGFADCNNGIIAGGSSVMVTTDGGATWTDRTRADFASLNISINGMSYPNLNRTYFATSVGALYRSTDQAASMDPVYGSNLYQLNDVAAIGNDSVWVVAYSTFNTSFVPAASRTSTIIRSFDNGASWQAIGGFPVGTTSPTLSKISFPTRQVGYVAGSRNAVYKTTDGGTTWTNISPFPSLNNAPTGFPNAFVTYQEVVAVDENTVFLIGNMFTNTGVKRVYKSTDGGANWTDITGSIPAQFPVGNLVGLTVHDANNLYVSGGNVLFKTSDGGANWIMDVAPAQSIFETMAFAPATVPAGIPFANRKLFLAGLSVPQATGNILEYGNPANVNVNTTETVVNANCTNLTAGSITVNATGGLAPYTFSINGGAFQSSNVFTGLTQGPKTITIKDSYCGVLTKTVTVGFTDNLVLTTNNDTTVCANAPVQMTAATNGTGATYAWTPSSGLSAANISNPIATVSANAAFTVTATLNGCVKNKTVNIIIKPNPVIDAGQDKLIVEGDQAVLSGTANNPVSVAWTPSATLSFANTLTPVAKPNTTTVYTLTVRNSDGCTSTDNATVTVIPYCAKVMNAFTPNRDGSNDLWLVTNGAPCTNRIRAAVYNRYGQEVYKSENYQNNWDGTYNGKPVPDGTYYYAVTYYFIGGRQVILKGDVTILR